MFWFPGLVRQFQPRAYSYHQVAHEVNIFSGWHRNLLKSSPKGSDRSIVPPCGFLPHTASRALLSLRFGVLNTQKLAHMLDSLVRVTTGQIRLFRHDRETADHVKHCTLVDTATHTVCYSATSSKPPNATIAAYQSSISVALGLGASFEDRTLVFSRNTNRP